MTQVTRSAAATQSVTEYVHRTCELRYECGERQWGILQVLCQAVEAAERVEKGSCELKASLESERQAGQVRFVVGSKIAITLQSLRHVPIALVRIVLVHC